MLDDLHIAGGSVGQARQHGADVGVIGFQQWQQLVTDAIAGVLRVVVGVVVARLQIALGAIAFDIRTRSPQKRSDCCEMRRTRQRAVGLHAAQTSQACAAQQPHQYRFGLVVGVVGQCNNRRAMLFGYACQKGIAHIARGYFDGHSVGIGMRLHIGMLNHTRHTARLRKRAHKFSIFARGIATQAMVEVGDDWIECMLRPQESIAHRPGTKNLHRQRRR